MQLLRKDYKKIKRVSPSQYHSMRNCPFKLVLAETYEKIPLLPISPYAYMGTIIHRVLEKIIKGKISNENEFDLSFNDEVQKMEQYLKNNGLQYYVPLQENVKDFGMKKILLKRKINYSESQFKNTNKYISEKWFETNDGILGGKIDLIIASPNDIIIIDFKTGNVKTEILDDKNEQSEVRDEYKTQLKLYAFLYYDTEKKFPTKLYVVNMQNEKFNVDFSKEECETLYAEVKKTIYQINNDVEFNNISNLAKPSEKNCKGCLYRPACSFYIQYLNKEINQDLSGIITNLKKYLNGSVSVSISDNNNLYDIKGFKENDYEYFLNNSNKKICIYNLYHKGEFSYQVTKTTTIYECE